MTAMFRPWRWAFAFALLAGLVACSSSPQPRLFTLASRQGPPAEQFSGTIAVKPVDFPKYLDRPQLVRYADPYELKTSEFDRWGEGMPEMLTRVLINDLQSRWPRSHVVEASGPLTVPSDATIEVDISRFEAEPAGTVVLTAQWVLQREGKKAQVRSEQIRIDAAANDPNDLVAAMSDAVGQLSSRIASSVSSETATASTGARRSARDGAARSSASVSGR
jgi:uncharacterized lipoprotein YmbA